MQSKNSINAISDTLIVSAWHLTFRFATDPPRFSGDLLAVSLCLNKITSKNATDVPNMDQINQILLERLKY